MGYRNYGPSNGFIVDAASSDADFATIQSAVTAAPANTTIFIKPGTYTENITLASGKNLAAWTCDALTPNVTIAGTITVTSATTVSISGIRLQTNSAALLAVTGSAASIVNLNNCYLNCSNTTGISFTSSSASAQITVTNCQGNLGTTGIAIFNSSSPGNLGLQNCNFANSGGSTTANTISAGLLSSVYSTFSNPITTSAAGVISINYCIVNTILQNVIALTHGGSGTNSRVGKCALLSGSAAAASIGGTLTMDACEIFSTNATAVITGAGTLLYTPLTFTASGQIINITNQTPLNYGTWTPTINGAVSGTTTYLSQEGLYTIVGNLVYIEGSLNISAATGTGNAIISGLPFTVKNLAIYNPIGNINLIGSWAWTGTGTMVTFLPQTNTKTALISCNKASSAASNLQMTNAAEVFIFSAWYQI